MNTTTLQQARWVLLSALATALIAVNGSAQGKSFFFICLLGFGPLLAALHGKPRQIAILSLLSLALAAAMGWRDGIWLTPDHVLSMIVVAVVCGGAVHLSYARHRMGMIAHKRAGLLKLLEQVAEESNNAVSFTTAVKVCLDAICSHTHWPVGHAYVRSPDNPAALASSRLWHPDRHWAHHGTPAARFRDASETLRISAGEGLCGRVLAQRKPLSFSDLGKEAGCPRSDLARAAGLRGFFAFPVFADGETAAVLEFFSHEARLPDPDLLELLSHIGALLGRVAERQQAMAAISESEARFRALAHTAVDAVIIVDERDKIVYWNPTAETMFGHRRPQALGKEMTLILPARYHAAHQETMARLHAAGERELVGQLLHPEGLRRDGTEFPIEFSFSRWQSAGKKYFGAIIRDASARDAAFTAQRQVNARLRSSTGVLQVRNREIGLLAEMARTLAACAGFRELYEEVQGYAIRLMPRSGGAVYRLGEGHDRLECQSAWGSLAHRRGDFPAGACPALQSDAPAPPGNCAELCPDCPLAGLPPPALCLPLTAAGENFGLLLWHDGIAPEESLADKRPLLAGFAGQVAMAMRNLSLREELQRRSVRDPLTGFYNRRHLEESLARELNRASRRGRPLALVMFDLDHFKRYNDTLGHPAGDALLRDLCAFLAARTRGEDVLCRYGGDEFVLIMPETTAEQAAAWAEQMRNASRSLPVMNQSGKEVTISFGVAEYPHNGAASAELVASADGALYLAKGAGRNRVVTAQTAEPPLLPEPASAEVPH